MWKIISLIVLLLIPLMMKGKRIVHNCNDRDYLICARTIKKYSNSQLLKTLKKDNDFFIAVLTYNSEWGMYPSYIYIDKPIQSYKGKANIIVISRETCNEISQLIDKYIDFEKPLFIKHGKNSLPAMFHVVIVYRKGKTAEMILSQLNNKITNKYEDNIYTDKPFIFLSKLADMTDTGSMFESIYGFFPILLKK